MEKLTLTPDADFRFFYQTSSLVTFTCSMDFNFFPFDEHICTFQVRFALRKKTLRVCFIDIGKFGTVGIFCSQVELNVPKSKMTLEPLGQDSEIMGSSDIPSILKFDIDFTPLPIDSRTVAAQQGTGGTVYEYAQ